MKHSEIKKLGEILTLEYGSGLKGDVRSGDGYPVVGSSGVIGYHNKFIVKGPGITVGRKGTIGGLTFLKDNFWPIDTAYFVNPKIEFDWKWMFFYLSIINFKRLSLSDVVPGLKRELVYNLNITLPPLPEQKAISDILSTVDDAIQKSDEVISRTERIKNAMMKKLLSEGISHTEFVETKQGRIPADWKLVIANEVCSKVTDGTHDSPKPMNEGFLLYTSKNIKNGTLNNESAYFISEEEYDKANKRSRVDTYDILFSMIGTVGEAAIVQDSPVKFAIKNVGLFKMNCDAKLSTWMYYYLNSEYAKNYILRNLKGSTQKYITLEALKLFPVQILPDNERDRITNILSVLDGKISLQLSKKQTLLKIKKSLMNDFLTGKKDIGKIENLINSYK